VQPLHFEPGHEIAPLIEADETFAEIERAIDTAAHEVFMAYWTLAPHLSLVTDAQEDWIGLLTRAARRGVRFRILLADFDPVFTLSLHRDAWRTFHRLRSVAALDGVAPEAMQVICSRNLALPNLAERLAGQVAAQFELRSITGRLNTEADGDPEAARAIHASAPGLWPHLALADGRFRKRRPHMIRPLPGSHHEKICIVDRRTAFVGGLDIGERRYDTADHEDDSPWHDLACRVRGPSVARLPEHFIARWNVECREYSAYVDALPNRDGHEAITLKTLETLSVDDLPPDPAQPGAGEVAVASSPVRNADRPEHRSGDIASAVRHVIGSAGGFMCVGSQ